MDRGLGSIEPPVLDVEEVVLDPGINSIPDPEVDLAESSAVHDSLTLGLDFSPGRTFANKVKRDFFSTVHPNKNSFHLTMVVSFDRASFRLSEDMVAIALESAIGGLCDELKVSILRDRVFSFTVSSKQIGFLIYQRHYYFCKQFKCCFHLWGRGGPNWIREFHMWQKECQVEWTLVSPSKRTTQLGMNAIRTTRNIMSVVRSGKATPKMLTFTTIESYKACKGYRYPATIEDIADLQQSGYVLSSPEKSLLPKFQ
jgi:hypothetical protein